MKDLDDSDYRKSLTDTVSRAIELGASNLQEVCALSLGANPTSVEEILKKISSSKAGYDLQKSSLLARKRAAVARAQAAKYLSTIPAANPEHSQWWFTLSGVEALASQIFLRTASQRILFLGASTLAPYYTARFNKNSDTSTYLILDIDPDLIRNAKESLPHIESEVYDAADPLPSSAIKSRFTTVIVDPPWYSEAYEAFLVRASEACAENGTIVATLPGIMTRPNESVQRNEILLFAQQIGLANSEIISGLAEYGIPPFEQRVLKAVATLDDRPWRYGDIAFFRKERNAPNCPIRLKKTSLPKTFFRKANEFRFFFSPEKCDTALREAIVRVEAYANTVSQRAVDSRNIALWTSTKEGFQIREAEVVTQLLEDWKSTQRLQNVRERLGNSWTDTHRVVLDELRKNDLLGDDPTAIRRSPKDIRRYNKERLSEWATPEPSDESKIPDGYRTVYARDRDRIVWSTSLRRLANKTQVFPSSESDHVRHRLAHSIEVMQLASTVGESLGLDRDLIEAGALAHDVGHTPFGHAGETAINHTMLALAPNSGGFNHYEHGLDVVRWLESAYRHPGLGEQNGLNLSNEVLECIFKHTFCYSNSPLGQVELLRASKHFDKLQEGPCHLEGQAVRSADKISYLISDIEDGLALGAVTLDDLRECKLFKHAPLDLKVYDRDSPLDVFLAQRGNLIGLLMEDLIDEASRQLLKLKDRHSVRKREEYTIDHSKEIRDDLNEVWQRVQSGKLHKDRRVISANRKAAEIIHQLVVLFTFCPEMIDLDFRRRHGQLAETPYMKWYLDASRVKSFPREALSKNFLFLDYMISPAKETNLRMENLVMAKDYVASMTDRTALDVHTQIFSRTR